MDLQIYLKRKTYRLVFPLLIVLLIVVFSCNFDIHKAMMPEEIQGMKLTQKLIGEEAADVIIRLHGKDVVSQNSIILHYQSEQKQATIYVSIFQFEHLAAKSFQKMVKKIRLENSGFNRFNRFSARGLAIYSVQGYGQTHFFFAHYNHIFWLAIDPSIARRGLAQILEIDEIELPEM